MEMQKRSLSRLVLTFPDALAATPLASSHFAPLLLTKKDSLPVGFADELKRLGAKDVILVGGTGAISEKVQNQIKGLGIKIERISGKNRYETAVKIAEKVGMEEALFVTTGANFADSLSISPSAVRYPIEWRGGRPGTSRGGAAQF